ncbi:vitamin K epoxide reductase [bacterium]|nr:vitamin K epoxide reductase [bacterium]
MKQTISRLLVLLLALLILPMGAQAAAPAQEAPTVRAVLFWMSTCGYCHEVIDNVLPPLQRQYGNQLDIQLIELKTDGDFRKLSALAMKYGQSGEGVGVPLMVIGDHMMRGAAEIPAELPGYIETYMATGGVEYPELGAFSIAQGERFLVEGMVLESTRPAPTEVNGFWLAIVVMAGIILALLYAAAAWMGKARWISANVASWALPVLAVFGLGISGYMAYVEMQSVEAVCGPVGDCNAVQGSPYAYLFGILPIGILGLAGYTLILIAWAWSRMQQDPLAVYAPKALFGFALVGVFFSLYLTYLEPFVIGAVCMWCLSSAVVMTLLLITTLTPALKPQVTAPTQRKRSRKK